MLGERRVPTELALAVAVAEAHGLGLFVFSLAGIGDQRRSLPSATLLPTLRGAALVSIDLIAHQLRQLRAAIGLLDEAPFGVDPTGPESLFSGAKTIELVVTLQGLRVAAEPLMRMAAAFGRALRYRHVSCRLAGGTKKRWRSTTSPSERTKANRRYGVASIRWRPFQRANKATSSGSRDLASLAVGCSL